MSDKSNRIRNSRNFPRLIYRLDRHCLKSCNCKPLFFNRICMIYQLFSLLHKGRLRQDFFGRCRDYRSKYIKIFTSRLVCICHRKDFPKGKSPTALPLLQLIGCLPLSFFLTFRIGQLAYK